MRRFRGKNWSRNVIRRLRRNRSKRFVRRSSRSKGSWRRNEKRSDRSS
jgi:hypothetical protein